MALKVKPFAPFFLFKFGIKLWVFKFLIINKIDSLFSDFWIMNKLDYQFLDFWIMNKLGYQILDFWIMNK
jgi:hypothetical protein